MTFINNDSSNSIWHFCFFSDLQLSTPTRNKTLGNIEQIRSFQARHQLTDDCSTNPLRFSDRDCIGYGLPLSILIVWWATCQAITSRRCNKWTFKIQVKDNHTTNIFSSKHTAIQDFCSGMRDKVEHLTLSSIIDLVVEDIRVNCVLYPMRWPFWNRASATF